VKFSNQGASEAVPLLLGSSSRSKDTTYDAGIVYYPGS
jgi:hypothetical protein